MYLPRLVQWNLSHVLLLGLFERGTTTNSCLATYIPFRVCTVQHSKRLWLDLTSLMEKSAQSSHEYALADDSFYFYLQLLTHWWYYCQFHYLLFKGSSPSRYNVTGVPNIVSGSEDLRKVMFQDWFEKVRSHDSHLWSTYLPLPITHNAVPYAAPLGSQLKKSTPTALSRDRSSDYTLE